MSKNYSFSSKKTQISLKNHKKVLVKLKSVSFFELTSEETKQDNFSKM